MAEGRPQCEQRQRREHGRYDDRRPVNLGHGGFARCQNVWRQSVSRGMASTLSLGVRSPRASCTFSASSSSPTQRNLRTRFTSSFFAFVSAEALAGCVRGIDFKAHSPFPLSANIQRQRPLGNSPSPGLTRVWPVPVFSAFFVSSQHSSLDACEKAIVGHSADLHNCSVAALCVAFASCVMICPKLLGLFRPYFVVCRKSSLRP
jgi:hypothetical protein